MKKKTVCLFVCLFVGGVYFGCSPTSNHITKRRITHIKDGLVTWEPIGEIPRNPYRTMKKSSFRSWVKGMIKIEFDTFKTM